MSEDTLFDKLLVRYRTYNENSVDAFQNDRLYFSAPKHFNDPFVIHESTPLPVYYLFDHRILHLL